MIYYIDLYPRNMLVYDGRITLLDKSMSGYFPRLFNYITHRFSPFNTGFFKMLELYLETITHQEEKMAKDVIPALHNYQIYR